MTREREERSDGDGGATRRGGTVDLKRQKIFFGGGGKGEKRNSTGSGRIFEVHAAENTCVETKTTGGGGGAGDAGSCGKATEDHEGRTHARAVQ